MPRNVRSYDHFCLTARALEQVGDRWTLLVIRDLLIGPKRFTDLMDRLGGITPKTLSQRLTELEDAEIVAVDREPGRREVWYSLTPTGADLRPVVDSLTWWGLRHAWRWPRAGEPLHAEHLLEAVIQGIEHAGNDHEPARWHFRLDGSDYLAESDGRRWLLTAQAPPAPADVTVTATTGSLAALIFAGSDRDVDIAGEAGQVRRFRHLVSVVSDLVNPREAGGSDEPTGSADVAEPAGAADLEQAAAEFMELRPRLFGIAYRMLGSASEAEDLVQEVWLRWQEYDRSVVTNPAAFLATTTTRLAINALDSARVRRETYIGPWLPEPVDTSADPYLGAERGEALELAALLLMEKLTPNERAAYVLREAFDYPYAQIAEILRSTEPAARQLVSRARKHMIGDRRTPVSAAARRDLLTSFVAAARSGDMTALERLFTPDVTSLSDGNGATRVSRRPVVGAVRVAKYMTAMSTWFWDNIDVRWANVNGQTSAVLLRDGALYAVLTVTASAEGIDHLLWTVNPDKLTAVPVPG